MKVGSAIKKCRQLRHITLETLAARINLSKSYLSLVENDKRSLHLDKLDEIANALDIPVQVLIYLASDTSAIKEVSPQLKEEFDKLIYKLIADE